jgi:aminoglycoside phosphotransferase (APT) family kinase protein
VEKDQIGAIIGLGAVAEVRSYGEQVVKLYPAARKAAAFAEAAILARLEPLGLPAPRAREVKAFEERWGVVMDRAEGLAFGDTMQAEPETVSRHLDAMVALHLKIHAASAPNLPQMKARLASRIAATPLLGEVSRRRALELLREVPDGDQLCHGDFHPFNVLGTPDGAMVVDWLDAACGAPVVDVCRSYVLMRQHSGQLAEDYAQRYARAAGLAVGDILRWVPVVAAARLAENVAGQEDMLVELAEGR